MVKIKGKKNLLLICGFILISLVVIQIIRINIKYPAAEEIKVGCNEEILYSENIVLSVVDVRFMKRDDVKTFYKNEYEHFGDCKAVEIEVSIKNTGNSEEVVDLSSFILQSGAWKNAMLLNVFSVLNEKQNENLTLHPVIQSGETINYILPFNMIPESFTQKQWENIEKQEYNLLISLYPYKKVITCETKNNIH